jgi:hypothetical protein
MFLTNFKSNQIFLDKISHRFLRTIKYLGGERATIMNVKQQNSDITVTQSADICK